MCTFGTLGGVLGGSGYSGLDGTLKGVMMGDETLSEGAQPGDHRSGCRLHGLADILSLTFGMICGVCDVLSMFKSG